MVGALGLAVITLSCAHKGQALQPASPPVKDEYIIGAGDALGISVWKDEALTRETVVRPDGYITFPLVGEIVAAGKTASQLKAELEKKLSGYVLDATVTVDVRQAGSMFIFVMGKVNAPGRFVVNSNINVLQALATAGGLNAFAKESDIKIFREENGQIKTFSFDYDDVVKGRHLEQNIRLKRGDIIVVP
jgi:polysaccharide export outer membrane protein